MQFKKWTYCLVFIGLVALIIFYFYPSQELPSNTKIDLIVVYKSKKRMEVFSNGKRIKTYKISIGKNAIGKKEIEGDNKTPEGIYYIDSKNPNSGYYKNLGISYPNKNDILNAQKKGKPSGGNIKIHGLKNGMNKVDKFHYWFSTRGCIRVTNNEMDELYNATPVGTMIDIKP